MINVLGRIISFYASIVLFYGTYKAFAYASTLGDIDRVFGYVVGTFPALIGLILLVVSTTPDKDKD